jgi:hypothetical protein
MANVKNYGLNGVSADLQYGKAGGRVKFDGSAFAIRNAADDGYLTLSGAAATADNHFVTKSQLDSVSAGLDLKESVRVATTTTLPAYTASGSGVGKTLTADANGVLTIDGVATVLGDRILVKDEGASNADHGIYEVTTEGDGSTAFVLTRATDADGTPSNEVSTGMFCFVEEGTANSGSGWVLVTANPITVDTTDLQFSQFSESTSFSAGDGLQLNGSTFSFDIDSLGTEAGTIAGSDTIALGDGVLGGTDTKATFTKVMNDLNIVNVADYSAGIEFIANTAADTYSKYTLVASAIAGDEGASVVQNGSTIEFGLDIDGLTDNGGSGAGTDEIVVFDGNNNVKTSITDLLADNNVANLSSNGIAVRTAAGTYAARSVVASADTDQAGIEITNGDGVAGNMEVGLNINGLTDIGVDTVLGTDYLVVSDTSDGNANKKVTIQEVVDLALGSVTTNQISEGDTSITATDLGTGDLNFVVDGTTVATMVDGQMDVVSLSVDDLAATHVIYAGTDGELQGEAGFTYIEGSNTLNVPNITSTGTVSADALEAANGGLTVSGTGGISTNSGNISSTSGDITTGGAMSATGTITATGGLIDSTLTINGGVTYSDSTGNLTENGGFTFDGTTLTVPTLSATSVGATDELIQFGNASGGLDEDAGFSFNGDTDKVLTVGNLDIDGTNQTITGNVTDGDISIIPDGTGEVIIGSTGAGVIGSEASQSMTLSGDTDLFLDSNSGSVYIRDNDGADNVAVFDANASADNWFTFTAPAAGSALEIGTNSADDIQFTLGTGSLLLVGDAADYETALASASDAAIVTKGYVDDQISSGASQGSIQTRIATVDTTSATTTSIGAAMPAGAIVTRIVVNVTSASASDTGMTVGISGNTDKYATAAEIDTTATGTYIIEGYFLEGSSETVTVEVATGSAGSVNVFVEYRVPTA